MRVDIFRFQRIRWGNNNMDEEDNTSPTTVKTLWTETILEVLYLALMYDKPDEDIRSILKQMSGCKPNYIIQKVQQKLGDVASIKIRDLIKNKPETDGLL